MDRLGVVSKMDAKNISEACSDTMTSSFIRYTSHVECWQTKLLTMVSVPNEKERMDYFPATQAYTKQ